MAAHSNSKGFLQVALTGLLATLGILMCIKPGLDILQAHQLPFTKLGCPLWQYGIPPAINEKERHSDTAHVLDFYTSCDISMEMCRIQTLRWPLQKCLKHDTTTWDNINILSTMDIASRPYLLHKRLPLYLRKCEHIWYLFLSSCGRDMNAVNVWSTLQRDEHRFNNIKTTAFTCISNIPLSIRLRPRYLVALVKASVDNCCDTKIRLSHLKMQCLYMYGEDWHYSKKHKYGITIVKSAQMSQMWNGSCIGGGKAYNVTSKTWTKDELEQFTAKENETCIHDDYTFKDYLPCDFGYCTKTNEIQVDVPLTYLVNRLTADNLKKLCSAHHIVSTSKHVNKGRLITSLNDHKCTTCLKYVCIFVAKAKSKSSPESEKQRYHKRMQNINYREQRRETARESYRNALFPPPPPSTQLQSDIIDGWVKDSAFDVLHEEGCAVCGILCPKKDLVNIATLNLNLNC